MCKKVKSFPIYRMAISLPPQLSDRHQFTLQDHR